ncbi:MAG: tyrosine-protein phosphatase [Chloroflexi bacterium]|nr:tyrosine-protein phosphatase [Chloroflexota bacterium]MCI0576501.1 tyrosine-protein phosphatase [Chloroflexota bacterium]MCI0650223.1 tyrosine-protein phosphatase [Chloroflexota bacterium]MCI0729401.1 tyrosine-protein phosphatase [Chloroflexota bacterium]
MNMKPRPEQRHLAWEGCYNARDLGGLPTVNGGETRWQAVIRSDLLGRLTAQGRQALLDYGVRTIIDLRGPQEVQEQPSAFTVPTNNLHAPTYVNLPLEKYHPPVSALINKAASRAEVYCIILDHYPDATAEVMRAIAGAPPGGVVIHCHSGTDRTGIVAALLLSLAGVPVATIAADYAESQVRLRHFYEKIAAEAGDEAKLGFWARPTATAEMMHTMLAHVNTTYGGVRDYLTKSGLSLSEIERLQNRLRPTS